MARRSKADCSRVVCNSVKAGECDGCELSKPAEHGQRYPLKYGWCWHREINVRLNPANVQAMAPATLEPESKNDWAEDAAHENGQYFNRCLSCDGDFIGHKRRHICRKCHYEAKAQYDAMTPEEQAARDAFIAGEIAEFYRTNAQSVPPADEKLPD